MKKHEIIFSIIKVPLDFIIIFSSFFLARQIRLATDLIPNINLPVQTIDTYSLSIYAIIGSTFYIGLLASHKIYSSKITNSKIKEIIDIIRYGIYGFIFFSVFVYLTKGFIGLSEIPRLIILFTFFFGTGFVILERIILNNINYLLLRKNLIPKKKVLLINNKKDKEIKAILSDIENANVYKIVGYINKKENNSKLKFLGKLESIEKLFEKNKIDEIIYIDSDFDKKELYNIWDLSRIFGIRYRYITNSFDITALNTDLSLINNIPVIEIKTTPLESIWGRFFKRLFDILMSFFGIIISSPIMIIVSILIKLEDPKGPIIYKNKRVGTGGKEFNLYKFRYMKWEYCIKDSYGINPDEDKALKYEKKLIEKNSTRKGPLYKIKNDPRKTKIGDFIEKYSIDELPQFFNSLIGNMSIVGPRPHQPREIEKYMLHQKRVLTVKPGITGMAQVNGRDKNSFSDEVDLDIFYIENWSFILDLKIILKTISSLLKR